MTVASDYYNTWEAANWLGLHSLESFLLRENQYSIMVKNMSFEVNSCRHGFKSMLFASYVTLGKSQAF